MRKRAVSVVVVLALGLLAWLQFSPLRAGGFTALRDGFVEAARKGDAVALRELTAKGQAGKVLEKLSAHGIAPADQVATRGAGFTSSLWSTRGYFDLTARTAGKAPVDFRLELVKDRFDFGLGGHWRISDVVLGR